MGDEFSWCCWPHPASLPLLREGLLMGSAVPAALADVGQWNDFRPFGAACDSGACRAGESHGRRVRR